MKKQKEVCRAVAVVAEKPVESEVMPPLGKIEEPDYTRPAECINFHLGMAQHHGRVAIAHLIVAGQELAKQKQVLGYGGWNEFCDKELSINRITADRYVKFFYKVIVERRVAGIPFDKRVTNKELAEATVGMEGKSATRAMVDLGIIKRSGDWGGKNRGQGRKPKVAAQPSDVDGELCAEEGRDLLKSLSGWALGADDGFGTFDDNELEKAVKTLSQMLARAKEILESRKAGGGVRP